MTGTIIKTTGLISKVLSEDNNVFSCRIKGSLRLKDFKYTNPLAVGDVVEFSVENFLAKTGIITSIRPRDNFIGRKAINNAKLSNILASNISQALLIITINSPETSLGFIDRFIVSAEANSIETILILNKIDILNKYDLIKSNEIENIYTKLGYKFIRTSNKNKFNFDIIKASLMDKTSLIVGHSGVGKSSMINNLRPALNLKTGDISSYNDKGTHTTTFTQMYNLYNPQTFIIDSPGIKELGLVYIDKSDIRNHFREFVNIQTECKFNNCMHINEPACKVLEALHTNNIAHSRYKNYLALVADTQTT